MPARWEREQRPVQASIHMNHRNLRDIVIVGGGVVGASCALALAQDGWDVALIETTPPPAWDAATPDLRVYAIAPDNAALLASLGIWTQIRHARAQAYRQMRVWDAGSGGELTFDADRLGCLELGWIVESSLLLDRLWAALPPAGVDIHCPARIEALHQTPTHVRLRLTDGRRLETRLVIAADGASSAIRILAGIDTTSHCYAQRGIVGYIRSEYPHRHTAWQRFLPTGPLALLPFAGDGHLLSIVWTLPEAEATRILSLSDNAFSRELTSASAARLGALHPVCKRAAFPLKRQLAHAQHAGRVLVIGDAAHVVHPLAGQGVNLGLRDVTTLHTHLREARQCQRPWDSPQRLARWARTRRSDNTLAAHTFDAINHLFSNDAVLPTLLRGHLLTAADRLPGISFLLGRHALGKAHADSAI